MTAATYELVIIFVCVALLVAIARYFARAGRLVDRLADPDPMPGEQAAPEARMNKSTNSDTGRKPAIMADRTYTHPDVFTIGVAEGWAEAEADATRIDWAERQARAAIPFAVVDGRPVNPCEQTAVRYGRNEMGFWGEQLMADALVTVTLYHTSIRYLLMVERGDGYGWAVPGGHVDPGETGLQAAVRELAEETCYADVRPSECAARPPRYVPDPRSSDEAWAVTVPVHISQGMRYVLPEVTGSDDARRAEWVAASNFDMLTTELAYRFHGRVFAAHVAMLRDFLGAEVAEGRAVEMERGL